MEKVRLLSEVYSNPIRSFALRKSIPLTNSQNYFADEVLSTGGICRYAGREDVTEMIVGTELGIIHRLRKENPGKRFIAAAVIAALPFWLLFRRKSKLEQSNSPQ